MKKTLGVIAVGLVAGGVVYLNLPATPKMLWWRFDCPAYAYQTFEIVHRTSLDAPWQFYTNVVGTNIFATPNNKSIEMFTISKTWVTGYTNSDDTLYQKGFEP